MVELIGNIIKVCCTGVIMYFLLSAFNRTFAKMVKFLTILMIAKVILGAWKDTVTPAVKKVNDLYTAAMKFFEVGAKVLNKIPFI